MTVVTNWVPHPFKTIFAYQTLCSCRDVINASKKIVKNLPSCHNFAKLQTLEALSFNFKFPNVEIERHAFLCCKELLSHRPVPNIPLLYEDR